MLPELWTKHCVVIKLECYRVSWQTTQRDSSCALRGRVMRVLVEFLGGTRICSRGRELALSRQSISCLAYHVLYREIDHPREVMIERFWSSHEPKRARSCLGTALSRLRKGIRIEGRDWLELSRRGEPRISLSAPIWFDIVAFQKGVSPALGAPPGVLERPDQRQIGGRSCHTAAYGGCETGIGSWSAFHCAPDLAERASRKGGSETDGGDDGLVNSHNPQKEELR